MSREKDDFCAHLSDFGREKRTARLGKKIDTVLCGRSIENDQPLKIHQAETEDEIFLENLFQEVSRLAICVIAVRQWEKDDPAGNDLEMWQRADEVVQRLLETKMAFKLALALKLGDQKQQAEAALVKAFAEEMRDRLAQKQLELEYVQQQRQFKKSEV